MYVQNQETRCEAGKGINEEVSVTASCNDPEKFKAAAAKKEEVKPSHKFVAVYVAIEDTMQGLMRKYGKSYCTPSREKIQELLARYHNINISLRTLDRRIKEMRALNMIDRTLRNKRGACGRMEFHSNLYHILCLVVSEVKGFLRAAVRVVDYLRLPKRATYTLTTKEDLRRSFEFDGGAVPLDWIKDFRKQLSAA